MAKYRITEKSDSLYNGNIKKTYHVTWYSEIENKWAEFAFSKWFDTLEEAEHFLEAVEAEENGSVIKSDEVVIKEVEF